MIEAYVTPRLVQWARERYFPNVELAAEKLKIAIEKLKAWERGEARPTFRQAQALADKLHIPFGYLYLSAPPLEEIPLPDFRTVGGAHPRKPSPEFLDVLYDVLRKQEWYREYLKAEDAGPVPFIGRFNGAAPREIATDIRNTLGIDRQLRQTCRTWEDFLTEFVRKAEGARVLVLRSSFVGSNTRRSLDVDEFRGFAISDTLAPLVFINSRDAKAAQIFTLAHELAHLWIGASGISNPDYMERSGHQRHITDRHCDNIAAEVLVPAEDFTIAWGDSKPFDENVGDLARRYKVSAFVVLRRAYDLGKIQADMYRTRYQELLSESIPAGRSGGTFYPTFLARNSTTFTTTLMVAAAEGRVSQKEAALLLNVRLATLPSVEKHVLVSGLANA
jgi:Zn-dependent peptidase ImmA (M78 family)